MIIESDKDLEQILTRRAASPAPANP